MTKVCDFDWGLLDEATKYYATDLRQEMEKEARSKVVADEVQRLAEEEAHKTMDTNTAF